MDDLIDIVDYEGLYKINKNGDVWSCVSNIFMKNRIDYNGYKTLRLFKNGDKHTCFIHRLLGINFIPNPENLKEIDHINRDFTNNNLDNLRWCSRYTNNQNKGKSKKNKLGHKNIYSHITKSLNGYINEYWKILIRCNYENYEKHYNKNKYTLEEVVAFRNEKLLELGLEITD